MRDGFGSVEKWLDPKMASKAVIVADPDPEPDAEDAKPTPEREKWEETATFRALGHNEGVYYVASELTGQVRDLSEPQLGRSKSYYSLAAANWWETHFRKRTSPYFNVEKASRAIIASCIAKGVFHTGRYRGRGAWRNEDGHVLLHLGDRLLAPGAERYTVPERYEDGDRIYPRLSRLAGPAMKNPLSLDEAQSLLGLFEDLSWEDPVSGMLLAGWVVVSPFSGCLKYRPHIWITGPTECGKSTIINEVISPLLQCADRIHREAHMTSEAAMRQKLRGDALPVILDEADMVRRRAKANLTGLFDLARSASTGGTVSKGSPGGKVTDFAIRSMFMFASIVVGLSLEQDKNRVAVLPLKNPKLIEPTTRRKRWAQLQRQIFELVSPYNGRRLMARTAEWFRSGKFDQLLKITSKAAFHAMQSARAAELYGTLIAGAWTLQTDEVPDIEEVRHWMKDMGLGLDQVAEKAVQHSYECLSILMQKRIPIAINHVRDAAPIGQLVDVVAGQTEDIGIKEKDAAQALRTRGMIVRDSYLWVANTGEWLNEQYEDTPYESGWMQVLRTLPDVVVPGRSEGATTFYPGLRSRVAKIPLKSLQVSGF